MKKMITFFVTIAMIAGLTACQKSADTQAAPPALETDKDKASYAIGVNMAQALVKIKDEVNIDMVAAGLKDKVDGNTLLIEEADARSLLADFSKKLREKQMAEREALGQKNLEEGQAFLEANKAKPDVVTTESGLQYMVVKKGDGPVPTNEDRVKVHYRGTTIDGTEFDSSYEREEPVTLAVTGVIKGWTEALQLMPVGSTYKLFVPADLAYGPRGAGDRIGPNAVLVFDVELLEIVTPEKTPAETPGPEM
ncbi:FKBP-type peptidyl-prolyl cis-trans isomerase [Desulfosudis oleivorans]|uniref:Peptidyl-prolyl cis-trans isomerase n=1 Tax=Desulfosudis oleivorans (strain DSM 6200 / JCM 39069 / Hxd3) TaxID=96561 RepID=A8ZZY1_DESOH|nr:FKBP-type peptidyl-prolyl cis-trans isomerase [Desulfosudis oleivorans]ABW67381.1 peptidylprolyl isomerase FKBP-type [Desulfosudis oleivorans Hxd3]